MQTDRRVEKYMRPIDDAIEIACGEVAGVAIYNLAYEAIQQAIRDTEKPLLDALEAEQAEIEDLRKVQTVTDANWRELMLENQQLKHDIKRVQDMYFELIDKINAGYEKLKAVGVME